MNRMWWKEPVLLMMLGLASIGVVLSIRQLTSSPPGNGSSRLQNEQKDAELRRQEKESAEHIKHLEQRLREAEAKLDSLEITSDNREKIEQGEQKKLADDGNLSPITDSQISYQEALARAWRYLQSERFDPVVHSEILLALERAYAEKGLPPEANSNLVSTMTRMNEMGVSSIISEARKLPPEEARTLLQTFLDGTPKLSGRQRSQIKAALRRL